MLVVLAKARLAELLSVRSPGTEYLTSSAKPLARCPVRLKRNCSARARRRCPSSASVSVELLSVRFFMFAPELEPVELLSVPAWC